jgi:hypothetical protein
VSGERNTKQQEEMKMKRIANDVALATICYCIHGTQRIRIVDFPDEYALIYKKDGAVVYEGFLGDAMYSYKYSKYFDSKVHGIEFDEDENGHLVMVFHLFTAFEQYK